MDRSVAGRFGIGRPFGPFSPRRRDAVPSPRGAGRRAGARSRRWRALAGVGVLAHSGLLAIRRHRRLRLGLLVAAIALALLAGGWLWLRHSSLVAVERVQVLGVRGPEAGAIDLALDRAARQMSTLDVHPQLLRAAVAPYRVVRELHATPSFPHGLRIEVVEQLPVAAMALEQGRTAVAADGVV